MIKSYDTIADLFNAIKSDHSRMDWRLGYNTVRQELEALNLPADSEILDFGCGAGNFTSTLSEAGYQVTGLDVSAEQLIRARRRDNKGEYQLYRGLLAEQLEGRQFDAICVNLTMCVIPDTELRYILSDLHTLLKNGQKIIILEPNMEETLGLDYGMIRFGDKEDPRNGDVIEATLVHGNIELSLQDIYRTHDHYRELLSEADFVDIRIDRPKPRADWGPEWELARQCAPFIIITARRET